MTQQLHNPYEFKSVDDVLEKRLASRRADREFRAFQRAFYGGGVVASVAAIAIMDVGYFSNSDSSVRALMDKPDFLIATILVHITLFPIGVFVFGTGPGFFALLWMRFFPESRLGDG